MIVAWCIFQKLVKSYLPPLHFRSDAACGALRRNQSSLSFTSECAFDEKKSRHSSPYQIFFDTWQESSMAAASLINTACWMFTLPHFEWIVKALSQATSQTINVFTPRSRADKHSLKLTGFLSKYFYCLKTICRILGNKKYRHYKMLKPLHFFRNFLGWPWLNSIQIFLEQLFPAAAWQFEKLLDYTSRKSCQPFDEVSRGRANSSRR